MTVALRSWHGFAEGVRVAYRSAVNPSGELATVAAPSGKSNSEYVTVKWDRDQHGSDQLGQCSPENLRRV